MSGEFGEVKIGAREIYDQVIAVGKSVDSLVTRHADVIADMADHETRLRALERARWPLPSLAVLLALASLIAAIVPLVAH